MKDERDGGSTAEPLFGERIRALRTARDWSQEDVAQQMARLGFSWRQSTVAKTEAADRPIRVNEAAALANLFSVDLGDLVRPDVHPIADRLQHATSVLAAAEQQLNDRRRSVEETERVRDFCKLRVEALNQLSAYTEKPTTEALANAAAAVHAAYSSEEWKTILTEAGLPEDALEAAEKAAKAAFFTDASREGDRPNDALVRMAVHVGDALAEIVGGGDSGER